MKTTLVLLLALLTFSSPDVFARGKKIKPPHIETVTADSITVKNGTQSRSYKITQNTSVEINGSRSAAADLKPGMSVMVLSGYDANVATSISAGNIQ